MERTCNVILIVKKATLLRFKPLIEEKFYQVQYFPRNSISFDFAFTPRRQSYNEISYWDVAWQGANKNVRRQRNCLLSPSSILF